MRIVAGLFFGVVCSSALASSSLPGPAERTLSFDDRVRAQAAIERVYYGHQLGTKKPFDDAVPRSVLEAKVHKYLDETAALSSYWKTAVTDYTLQRELERMAQGTKMPERLLELYAALGNDPFLIKECLARPALVDRLSHNFYAFDPTMHASAKALADSIHAQLVSGALSPAADHPNRTVREIVMSATDSGPAPTGPTPQRPLTPDEFKNQRVKLPAQAGKVSDITETREAFTFSVVLSETKTSVSVASYVVPKTTWDAWWETARRTVRGDSIAAVGSGAAVLPAPQSSGSIEPLTTCADDRWDPGVYGEVPTARRFHTAVWTGNVMVLWGGYVQPGIQLNSGSRYDPATDVFTPTSTVGAASPRFRHTAVWTGSKMIVWGGQTDEPNHILRTGGRYDPITDTWEATSLVGAPSSRYFHTAVWTGNAMVVWGGSVAVSPYRTNSGGKYDPTSDSWTPTSTLGAPAARDLHTAVWSGSVMVVWGGGTTISPYFSNTGGKYDPISDSWSPTSTTGAPDGRLEHTAVWTGRSMVIWGGLAAGPTGGRYDPSSDSWESTSIVDVPPGGNGGHTAVWTGSVMIIWGMYDPKGSHNTGGRYDPVADTWTPTSLVGAPSGRASHTAIWTGTQMIVWGGEALEDPSITNTGGRYDPTSDIWTPTANPGGPGPRIHPSVVWTGTTMVIWGGYQGPSGLSGTGGRYDPVLDLWTPTATTGAPIARNFHTAVWTGSKMIVWGGITYFLSEGTSNTGGQYDPISDSWAATSTLDAPVPRELHTAVWTGTQMIVWGGTSANYDYEPLNTGGLYDPITDAWTQAALVGAPSARLYQTAVWTGSEMVIWGGRATAVLASGGRYDPSSGQWSATSLAGAPDARYSHTAVWTDHEMVVWGGVGSRSDQLFNDGARYDPAADSWAPTSTVKAPSARFGHSAVWTGSEMIAWGGAGGVSTPNTGGRYAPTTNSWTATTTVGAPPPIGPSSIVWTGDQMLVWLQEKTPVGRYFPGTLMDDDCDGDGLTESAGDCDDHNAFVYPGAPQICDGVNNDCLDSRWPALPYDELDRDGDGFSSCQRDCYDNDSSTYPDAEQICDGFNNDCNDPSWPTLPENEADADFDGYPICRGDCDDHNRLVHPDAPEFCDGLDNNCDGVIDNGGDALCDDNNPCTDDICRGASFCSRTPNTKQCNDWNECTVGDVCGGGMCHPGVPTVCDDGNRCTTDTCNPADGRCVFSNVRCDDNDPCSDDACDPETGGCSHVVNTSPCDDGDTCTYDDVCADGVCAGAPVDCDDYNSCTDEYCDFITGCVRTENSNTCDDGDACTMYDVCGGGICAGTASDCDDQNLCTADSCDTEIGCTHFDNTKNCDDGNSCNGVESCSPASGCVAGTSLICNDNNPCTTDSCSPATGCVFTNNTTACNDGNACTAGDACVDGSCHGTTRTCSDSNPCTSDSCNPATGCVFANNSNTCDDGNACTTGDACVDGSCHGTTRTCNDNNPCTTDTCNPASGCVFADNSNSCDDGNACTTGDTCGGGSCHGATRTCADNNPCTTDSCNPASGCVFTNNANACDDGNACTRTDACSDGTCVGGNTVICGAADQCHDAGACNPATGACSSPIKPNGTVCDDASLCTAGETCQSGICTPTLSGLNHPRPKSSGYYKQLCKKAEHGEVPYHGDQITDADALCVASLTAEFSDFDAASDLCGIIGHDSARQREHPGDNERYSNECIKAENELIATALNICRARVCEAQNVDSRCGHDSHVVIETTVEASFGDANATLDSPTRTRDTCKVASCELKEINNGHALEMNSVLVTLEVHNVRLSWLSMTLDDGTGVPSLYEVWRRPLNSPSDFTKIATTSGLTYLDATSGASAWEYEVTAVIPGD